MPPPRPPPAEAEEPAAEAVAAAPPLPPPPASESTSSSSPLPVIDLASPSLPGLRQACETHGFFYLRGHGIPPSLLCAALHQCRSFFSLPLATKQTLTGKDHSQGYQALGTETLNKKEQSQPCTQEGFRLILTPPSPTQPWPDPVLLPRFRSVLSEYHAAMEAVAHRVTRLLLASVGLPPTYLHEEQNAFSPHAAAVTRLLHYSPVVSHVEEGVYGCGAHTDWGVLTLLLTEEEGLEVLCPREGGKEGGEWLRVPPCRKRKEEGKEELKGKEEEDEEEWLLICNLGDLLPRWSNDCLVSTPHRVVNREGKDRYSIPFFFSANPAAVVECLPPFLEEEEEEEGEGGREGGRKRKGKYPPIVVSEYIAQKYRSITVGVEEKGEEGCKG